MLFRLLRILAVGFVVLGGAAAEQIFDIPFSVQDDFICLEARTAIGQRHLRFVLDSGASRSVLDQDTAKELKLPLKGRVNVQGVNSIARGYWPVPLKAKVGAAALPSQFLALDLTDLSGECEFHIDGLIGLDFFTDRIVQIDFESGRLRILSSAEPEAGSTIIPMQTRPCGMRIPLTVNGRQNQWMRLDTGCVSPLQWVAPEIRPDECLGSRIAVGLTPFALAEAETCVELGAEKFQNVKTGVHSKPIFPGEAGLVGLGMLKNFKAVTIDSPGHRLILKR